MAKHIPDKAKEQIEGIIDNAFENTAREMLGYIPGKKKTIVFSSKKPSLTLVDLYLNGLKGKKPNVVEKDTLKGLIRIAYGYVAGLKERTKSTIINKLDAMVRTNKTDKPLSSKSIQDAISGEMLKARSHMKRIAETEGTKSRNMGSTMEITRVASAMGIEDPNVFFVVKRDEKTCLEENEIVITSRGNKRIGDVKVGDILKSPSNLRRGGGNKIIEVEKQEKKCLELDFGYTKIVCTEDHPVLIKSGPIFTFIEAKRITSDHDVFLLNGSEQRGELKKITTQAVTPKKFMVNLGYHDAWDFWRENIDDILYMIRKHRKLKPISEKYGIDRPMWSRYVKHIVGAYDSNAKIIGGVPNNRLNHKWRQAQYEKQLRLYLKNGGDSRVKSLVNDGLNSKKISDIFGLSVGFMRKKVVKLGLANKLRARGGVAT